MKWNCSVWASLWHYQPQGPPQIYNSMEFNSLNPSIFTLSCFHNDFKKTGIFRGLGFPILTFLSLLFVSGCQNSSTSFVPPNLFKSPRGWKHHAPNLDWGTQRKAQLRKAKPPLFCAAHSPLHSEGVSELQQISLKWESLLKSHYFLKCLYFSELWPFQTLSGELPAPRLDPPPISRLGNKKKRRKRLRGILKFLNWRFRPRHQLDSKFHSWPVFLLPIQQYSCLRKLPKQSEQGQQSVRTSRKSPGIPTSARTCSTEYRQLGFKFNNNPGNKAGWTLHGEKVLGRAESPLNA